jgi:hypothetical protein
MSRLNYAAIADRADALLLDLLLHHGIGRGEDLAGADVKSLQPALNEHLHMEIAEFNTGGVLIAAAGPVPSEGVYLRMLLEIIDHGTKVGAWMVDYDGIARLRRLDEGYLPIEPAEADESG